MAIYTGNQLADFCKRQIGQVYWYGTCVYPCTEKLLTSKTKQYPTHYTDSRMPTYRKHIAQGKVGMDCVGMIKGFFWTQNGTATNKYQLDCPDKSANGMFEYAQKQGMEWGGIGNMPKERGICVRLDGHVGVYVGGGYVVEARGFSAGVVRTKLDGRWKHWYRMPGIDYGTVMADWPTLRHGATGIYVKTMQNLLVRAGFTLPKYGADGEFGTETETVLKRAQGALGVIINGVCDAPTWHALENAPPSADGGSPDYSAPDTQGGGTLIVTGDDVNIRTGPGTSFESVGKVNKGDKLVPAKPEGWTAIEYGGAVRWISSQYVKGVDA